MQVRFSSAAASTALRRCSAHIWLSTDFSRESTRVISRALSAISTLSLATSASTLASGFLRDMATATTGLNGGYLSVSKAFGNSR